MAMTISRDPTLSFTATAREWLREGALGEYEGHVRTAYRAAMRELALTPMRRLIRRLEGRGVEVWKARALEMFGERGDSHTVDYADRVRALDVWELDPAFVPDLMHNLRGARIVTCDSYAELSRTGSKYDLVVVDNPMGVSHKGRCEHFGAFPAITRVLADRATVVLNVIPFVDDEHRALFPYLFGKKQLAMRTAFYGAGRPENIPIDAMVARYRALFAAAGFTVRWHLVEKRNVMSYLALHVERA